MKYFCLLCAILFACCAPATAAVTYEPASDWGFFGPGWGVFNLPSGVTVDSSGNIYVADTGNFRVLKFDKNGEYKTKLGITYGTTDGNFTTVVDIVVDSAGDVYVSDKSNRIQKFWPEGVFQKTWGTTGTANGTFQSVGGLGIDSSDNIYVADTNNHRIQKFTKDGTFVMKWGTLGTGNGQFRYPFDVAVDAAGTVFVADRYNYRIQMFSQDGVYLGNWTGGSGSPFSGLWGIATNADGNVLVTEEFSSRAWIFTPTDTARTTWEGYRLEYTFSGPRGIAADSAGNVYVVDRNNNRVEKFAPVGGPTAVADGPYSGNEGSDVNFSADRSTGSAGSEITLYEWDFDNDGEYEVSSSTPSATHSWDDDFEGTITLRVTDGNGYTDTDTASVSIKNVAPTPSIGGAPATSPEGTAITLTASAVDPGAADTEQGFTYAWSVTKNGTLFESGASGASFTFTPDDNGAYEVTLTATDKDGGQGTTTVPIAATNVAPAIETIDVAGNTVTGMVGKADAPRDYLGPFRADSPITVTVTFSDPGVPDTHTPFWDWGDGSAPSEQVGPRVRTLTATHTYTTPGFYTLSITLTDKDGGVGSLATLKPIVVYDPDGGSVTGGGWFTSPAGACTPENPDDADIVGKAHFAFASRYKTDATVPDSSVEFSLKQAKIDFKSTSVEWLVVDGAKAIYRGVGTLNGASGYRFLLSAIDDPSSDRIRVKVWTPSGVVYDSQPGAPDTASPSTEIGGGSIVIHP